MNSTVNDECRTTIRCPDFCAARLNNGDTCLNSVKYMCSFSDGVELFSCGIQNHIENIKCLNCDENDIKIYKRKSKNSQCFQYVEKVEKMTEFDVYTLRHKIETTFDNLDVLLNLHIKKSTVIDTINQITNTHRTPGSLENVDLINDKLSKFVNEIDNLTKLEYRQHVLSTFNLKFNEMYTNNLCYKLPFKEHGECTICFDHTNDKTTCGSLPCGHVFHNECISKWFKQDTHSCPNCRKEVNTKWYMYYKSTQHC